MLTPRENYFRNVRRTGPEWMPCHLYISGASWYEFGDELERICERFRSIFPNFKRSERPRKPEGGGKKTERDPWGCLWELPFDGLAGIVLEHPLDDWSKFAALCPPDEEKFSDMGKCDLQKTADAISAQKKRNEPASVGFPHGYFFMRLWYLRGFENLMMDIATDEPLLKDLCRILVDRNIKIVRKFLSLGVDAVHFGEDLGTQTASIISPKDFRKWIVPAYREMMRPVKEAGLIVDTHSDGYIIELVEDLLGCGCDVLNPQDLCNGIDNIKRTMKGRCCIKLDIDRQRIVPFGTRAEIHELIEEEVRTLGAPEGGLEMVAGIYPPTTPENVDALCEALEKWRTFWRDGRGKRRTV